MIASGISQIGGKFRLRKTLQEFTPNHEFFLSEFFGAGWIIEEVFTKYSTNANTQEEVKEYVIMNYDIKKESKMIMDNQVSLTKFMED